MSTAELEALRQQPQRLTDIQEILPRAPRVTAYWHGSHGKQLPKGAHDDPASGRYVR